MRLLAMIGWVACSPAGAGMLQGTASYRERIALPPDAVFEAVLEDVSRADAPAEALGRARIDPAGQPPFRFEIRYDDEAVQQGRRYAVRATVTHQGRLLFTSDRAHPVLDGRDAPLEMLLVSARAEADRPLRGTHWKLVRLGESPVEELEEPRAPHLVLSADELQVSGSGGCNRVSGGFELDGDELRFGQLASTMMACESGMEQEQRFLRSLERVERYRIAGTHLELLDAEGAVVARFEALSPAGRSTP
jgi:putative lipoprotein